MKRRSLMLVPLLLVSACGSSFSVSGSSASKPGGKPKPKPGSKKHTLPSYVRWKPVSEGDGNLVILLPADYDTVVVRVDGERGESSITNGGRPTYRFNHPGSYYASGVRVKIDGKTYTVSNPSQNYG